MTKGTRLKPSSDADFSGFAGKVLYILGVQYGDEGKGKLVDEIAGHFDAVCRAGGGANAGHTIWRGDQKFVTHLLPSGVLHPGVVNIIGAGVVVDPVQLAKEIRSCSTESSALTPSRLMVDVRATAVLKNHFIEDVAREEKRIQKTGQAIGTTGKGIGPAHGARAQREALRLGTLVATKNQSALLELLHARDITDYDHPEEARLLWDSLQEIAPFCGDASAKINGILEKKGKVLVEGAQGALLDLLFGTYPYVSSGQAHPGAALAGLGIPVQRLGAVWGVAKCYATRVGEGPFPGEIEGALADEIREKGKEYGSTTGRPRRVGWLDLESLHYVRRTFGVTHIALMKSDVLTGQKEVPFVTQISPSVQAAFSGTEFHTQSQSLKGWPSLENNSGGLNPEFEKACDFIAEAAGCPVCYVSLGPCHGQGLLLQNPT